MTPVMWKGTLLVVLLAGTPLHADYTTKDDTQNEGIAGISSQQKTLSLDDCLKKLFRHTKFPKGTSVSKIIDQTLPGLKKCTGNRFLTNNQMMRDRVAQIQSKTTLAENYCFRIGKQFCCEIKPSICNKDYSVCLGNCHFP